MLTFCILSSILIIFFYVINKYKKSSREIISLISLYSLTIVWSIFLFMDNERISIYILVIAFILLNCVFYYLFTNDQDTDPRVIYAKQQNYWDINSNDIIKTFRENEIEKEDRIEVKSNIDSLYINKLDNPEIKMISPNAVTYLKKINELYKTIIITNIDDIKKYPIQNKIFEKLVSFIEKDKELFLNYNKILKEFDNNLDFFIIYLWDNYSKDFNIGIGQLEALCKNNKIHQEFINALDNTNLTMIKLKGSYLLYKYHKFLEKKGVINE